MTNTTENKTTSETEKAILIDLVRDGFCSSEKVKYDCGEIQLDCEIDGYIVDVTISGLDVTVTVTAENGDTRKESWTIQVAPTTYAKLSEYLADTADKIIREMRKISALTALGYPTTREEVEYSYCLEEVDGKYVVTCSDPDGYVKVFADESEAIDFIAESIYEDSQELKSDNPWGVL